MPETTATSPSVFQRLALVAGPLALVATLQIAPPPGLTPEGWHLSGVVLWMVIWWLGQAAPMPGTALLPVVLIPLLGIAPIDEVTAQYANPLIFLFLGGFLMASAMQVHGLHRRIALAIVGYAGEAAGRIAGGFMLATALLSMWISNTATAMMMYAVALSVIEFVAAQNDDPEAARRFGVRLMLGIAYGASIGGVATLIGTPGNALLASVLRESYGIEIGFGQWMLLGLPLTLIMLPYAHFMLRRMFPSHGLQLAGAHGLIRAERAALGPMSRAEISVAVVFALMALGWMTRGALGLPISDAGIGIAGALILFALPDGRGGPVLRWEATRNLPWGVLILLGGGLALARGIEVTGLGDWIGGGLAGLHGLPLWALILTVIVTVIALTEVTSNTAVTATFVPVLAAVALGIGVDVPWLTLPVALASSMAFMMPIATPPNAIVFSWEGLRLSDMLRAGLAMHLLSICGIFAVVELLVPLIFGLTR